MAELRQQPRVVFSARARILSDGDEQSVVARIHNLSATGIYVTAPRPLRPGAAVKCRLFLGEEKRVLRGRVAWTKRGAVPGADWASEAAPANENAAGIHFVDLSPRDSALLQRLVTPKSEDERTAEIQFPGMPSPVRCRAVVARDNLRIVTRLPFLRLGSEVKVSFDNRGVRELRTGRLDALLLAPTDDDPVPRLLLSVSTAELEQVGGEIEVPGAPVRATEIPEAVPSTLVDEAALFSGDATVLAPPPVEEPAAPISEPRLPERSDPTQRVAMPTGPVTPPPRLAAFAVPRSSPTTRVVFAASAVAVAMVLAAYALGRGRRPAHHAEASAAPVHATAAAVAAPVLPRAQIPATEEPSPATIAIEPLPLPTPAANSPDEVIEDRGVRVERRGTQTSVFVPLEGSTRQANHYPLRSPAGIAVTLPFAQAREAAGRHAFSAAGPAGIVRHVLVDRRGSGVQLRFLFAGPVANTDVRIEANGVRLDVRVK